MPSEPDLDLKEECQVSLTLTLTLTANLTPFRFVITDDASRCGIIDAVLSSTMKGSMVVMSSAINR